MSDTNVNDSVVCITKGFSVIAFLVFFRMFYFVWSIERLIESVKMIFLRDEKWIMPALKTNFVYSTRLSGLFILSLLLCWTVMSIFLLPPKTNYLKKEWDDIRETFLRHFPAAELHLFKCKGCLTKNSILGDMTHFFKDQSSL